MNTETEWEIKRLRHIEQKYNTLKRASIELARICKEHAKTSTGRQRDLYSAVVLFEDATGFKVETKP